MPFLEFGCFLALFLFPPPWPLEGILDEVRAAGIRTTDQEWNSRNSLTGLLPKLPMTQITQISLGSFILTIILSALSRMDRFYIPWYQVLLFIIQVPWISKGENDCFLMSFSKLEVTGNLIPMPTLKDSSTKNHLRKHISPFQTIYHSLPTSRCLFCPVIIGEHESDKLA